MNIQIFGARKSFDTKKAERWFKERRIRYQYIDLDSKGLSPGEYRSIRAAVGYDALVDRLPGAGAGLSPAPGGGGEAAGKSLAVPGAHRPQRQTGHRGLLPRRVENLGITVPIIPPIYPSGKKLRFFRQAQETLPFAGKLWYTGRKIPERRAAA